MNPSHVVGEATGLARMTEAHRLELGALLGPEVVRCDELAFERFGRDATEAFHFAPEVVVLPTSTAEVSTLLAFAHRQRLAVTPRGAGTGLSGGALPVHGGIVLGLERMNQIRAFDLGNLSVEVEAGVVTAELQRAAEAHGLFYPPDPGSRETCCIGGNLAEDSAGPRSCKYGTTRRWVLGLEAVAADGAILCTGSANRKDVAGYNLSQLLVGSEGTLAVITAAVLRLIATPRHRLTLALPFADLEAGAAAVSALFKHGFEPAACELLEERAIAALGRLMPLPQGLAGQAALILLELDGQDGERLLEEAAALGELAAQLGAGEVLLAKDAADQRRLWLLRSRVGEAIRALSVYKEADTVVPRPQLAALVREARRVAAAHGLEALCFGHAGDGNLHVTMLRGELPEHDWQRRRDAAEQDLFTAVVALGGSITGEHGVGWTQRRYLPLVASPPTLELMRRVKASFDPHGILNPGKIFLA